MAALKPDLVVTNMYIKPELWYLNDTTAKQVEKLAPTLAINFQGLDLVESIESVEKVAARLGADLKDDDAVEARAAFDAASKRLAAVGDRLGDKTVLPVSATPDLFYAGDPAQFPDIAYYQSIGLPMADVKAKKGSYWDELSWEKSDKYDADVVLWDNRVGRGRTQEPQGAAGVQHDHGRQERCLRPVGGRHAAGLRGVRPRHRHTRRTISRRSCEEARSGTGRRITDGARRLWHVRVGRRGLRPMDVQGRPRHDRSRWTHAPKRLIVQSSVAAALTDLGLGDKIVGTFGPLKNAEGKPDSQVAGLDISKATDVTGGGEYGSIDLEKAASLKPDLVVTSAYLKSDLWYVNDATAKKLKQLAPILVVSFDGKTLPSMLDSTERAAKALGADLDSATVRRRTTTSRPQRTGSSRPARTSAARRSWSAHPRRTSSTSPTPRSALT